MSATGLKSASPQATCWCCIRLRSPSPLEGREGKICASTLLKPWTDFPLFSAKPLNSFEPRKSLSPPSKPRLFFTGASMGTRCAPGIEGKRRCRAGGVTVRHWAMSPQVRPSKRALCAAGGMLPKGQRLSTVAGAPVEGRTLAGHGRPRHVLKLERLGPVPRFPPLSTARCESRRGDGEVRALLIAS